MRKLELHMQISVDGFVCGRNGELDWMTWNLDPDLKAFIVDKLTDASDTILLGRKMTEGFVKHWEHQVAQGTGWDRDLGVRMVNMPKIMFSGRSVRPRARICGSRTGRWWTRSMP